jgi:iron(III) transport system ATP-binding protein
VSAEAARPAAVALEGIAKKFGQFVALRGITLSISPGEFICFLGPSGCGKTTLLRIVAGLERQNAGVVMMGGRDVSALPPSQRNYGIVFQSYALFPNLTVARNVGYGLETRHVAKAQIEPASTTAGLVKLAATSRSISPALGRRQQRIAQPGSVAPLLLLGQPLSALDAPVRQSLRAGSARAARLGVHHHGDTTEGGAGRRASW